MAGNYVRIGTSIADMLQIANGLRVRGRGLRQAIEPVIQDSTAMELNPDTFPRDDDTNDFMQNYEKDVPGSDGKPQHTNAAVKQGALSIGDGLVGMGDFLAGAMWGYQGGDDDNAKDIGSTKI